VGNVPDCILYVYGVIPPVTLLKVSNGVMAEFCTPATDVVAPAVATVVGTFTVKTTELVVPDITLFTSRTLNVTLAASWAILGVPDTKPVLLLSVIFVGNVPELI